MADSPRQAPGLPGRRSECETLGRLVASVRAGESRVLVLRGEAGIGKTALLDHPRERASGFAKLEISSRRELRGALPDDQPALVPS